MCGEGGVDPGGSFLFSAVKTDHEGTLAGFPMAMTNREGPLVLWRGGLRESVPVNVSISLGSINEVFWFLKRAGGPIPSCDGTPAPL